MILIGHSGSALLYDENGTALLLVLIGGALPLLWPELDWQHAAIALWLRARRRQDELAFGNR